VIPTDVRLYTWIDVEEVLFHAQREQDWPESLIWARAYWDSLTLGIRPGTKDSVVTWLSHRFEPRFLPTADSASIMLESTLDRPRQLDVRIEETNEAPVAPRFKPSLARPTVVTQPYAKTFPQPLASDMPPVVAFHSFKGGVGRTLCALALALKVAEQDDKSRVLLVDGDLEAPGLTWLLQERFPNRPVSMADLLALVHGDPDPDAMESIKLVAERVSDLFIDGVYVLPSFRSIGQFTSLEIKPEHLIQGSADPYVLTTVLAKLGKALGVQIVIVDLRAGLSELSTGLLLDPRVYRVFVTTLSDQSITGTCQLLEMLGGLAPAQREEYPLPALIIAQVPTEFINERQLLEPFEKRLLEAIQPFLENSQADTEEVSPLVIVNEFDSKLAVLPGNWNRLVDLLKRQGSVNQARKLTEWLPLASPAATMLPRPDSEDLKKQRERLGEFAEKMIFAERGVVSDFLAIPSLRNLASDFSARVPIAIVVGAKGSGKTFTFLQFAQRSNWETFVNDTISTRPRISATICPVLQSKNLAQEAQGVVNTARRNTGEALGLPRPDDLTVIGDYLRDSLQDSLHEGQWRERWLNMIAWSVGFEVKQSDAGRKLVEYLRSRKQSIVAIIDGLEDTFQALPGDEKQQVALRSLLQDVPEWLEQQHAWPVGLLVFVRQDMVLHAVRQNPTQLLVRYDPYALKWDAEEALRLVTWLGLRANVLELKKGIQELDLPELIETLVPLWGRKLGSEHSREGRAAAWVIAALSDLRGQIQARDIVRFINQSAHESSRDTYWRDRLLAPVAIKSAVKTCGKEKIKEIRQENPRLGDMLSKLDGLESENKQVPFSQQQVGLDSQELTFLEDTGVILREGEEYYLSEIFRQGLDFRVKAGARPRVLSLSRRLLGEFYR